MRQLEERDPSKRVKAICGCESCKKGRHESHKITKGLVHDYSEQPEGGWRPRMTLAEKVAAGYRFGSNGPRRAYGYGSQPYFLGVELETDAPNNRRIRDDRPLPVMPARPLRLGPRTTEEWFAFDSLPYDERMTRERAWERTYERQENAYYQECERIQTEWREAGPMADAITSEDGVSMARPRNLWLAKHDSSVSGPEFASQPATLAYWYSRKPQLENMFQMLLHAGFRSHEGDHCGMHVNISTEAFANSGHLRRFASLIHVNKAWSRRMSQRTMDSLHWSGLTHQQFNDPDQLIDWANSAMDDPDGGASYDRYSAINTPGGGRFEFRLPRGTLRIDRFFKNLEWTVAMIEYTRQQGKTLNPPAFMAWVMKNPEYPHLKAFITEKFAAQLDDVPETVTPTAPRRISLATSRGWLQLPLASAADFVTRYGESEPTCDICGNPQGRRDWNGETGNHMSCEASEDGFDPYFPFESETTSIQEGR